LLARSADYAAYIATQSELAEEVATQHGMEQLGSDEEELGDEETDEGSDEECCPCYRNETIFLLQSKKCCQLSQ
jgi:hypothetical protein